MAAAELAQLEVAEVPLMVDHQYLDGTLSLNQMSGESQEYLSEVMIDQTRHPGLASFWQEISSATMYTYLARISATT